MVTAKKYNSRIGIVDAVQLPSTQDVAAARAIAIWMLENGHDTGGEIRHAPDEFIHDGKVLPEYGSYYVIISTPNGDETATLLDYIIRDSRGAFRRCHPVVFASIYSELHEEDDPLRQLAVQAQLAMGTPSPGDMSDYPMCTCEHPSERHHGDARAGSVFAISTSCKDCTWCDRYVPSPHGRRQSRDEAVTVIDGNGNTFRTSRQR